MSKNKKRKKNQKNIFILLIIFALIVAGIIAGVVATLYKIYLNGFYPKNVLDTTNTTPTAYMESDGFNSLFNVAKDISKYGMEIFPSDIEDQGYHYNEEVYQKVYTSLAEHAPLVIARGTGSIKEDIVKYTPYYYSFTSDIEPSYEEMYSEVGTYNGYGCIFSTGKLTPGNFFRTDPFYICAMEFQIKDGFRVLYVYSCSNIVELEYSTDFIGTVAMSMFSGNSDNGTSGATEGNSNSSSDDSSTSTSDVPKDTSDLKNDTLVGDDYSINSYNNDINNWAIDYLQTDEAFSNTMGSAVYDLDNGHRIFENTSTVSRSNLGEVIFYIEVNDGDPVHAVLYSPDMNSYYEPTRYDNGTKRLYFYVVNPMAGRWHFVLEVKDSASLAAACGWYGITTDSDREYYLNGIDLETNSNANASDDEEMDIDVNE